MLSAGFQAQQTSAQATAAMGQYMYGGCAGADNETGFVHGCYERYRGKNYHYPTPSWATGHHRTSWILTRVRTGTRYAGSNPEIRDWRPKQQQARSSCADLTLSYRNTNSGVGLSLSVKEVICANSLDVLEINRYNFIAEWRGAARSARAAEAIDVICNHLDKPSGFGYYTGFFAV
jgi:hypothetical protein